MNKIDHIEFTLKATNLLLSKGVSLENASFVVKTLVETSLKGIDSHGINLIPRYLRELENGKIVPGNEPQISFENDIFVNIEGNQSFGQIAATLGIDLGIKKAQSSKISVVGVSSNHIGALGQYTLKAAESNLISFAVCNAGPNVAPFGGNKRFIGTNPISFSFPTKNYPIVSDFATSIYPENKVREHKDKNKPLPFNIILDSLGNPTTNPHDFYAGGSILPIGAHKGYGLGVSSIILGSIFNNAGFWAIDKNASSNGTTFILIDPEVFIGKEYFNKVESFIEITKKQPTIEGVDKILLPGEKEIITKQNRLKTGINISNELLNIIE